MTNQSKSQQLLQARDQEYQTVDCSTPPHVSHLSPRSSTNVQRVRPPPPPRPFTPCASLQRRVYKSPHLSNTLSKPPMLPSHKWYRKASSYARRYFFWTMFVVGALQLHSVAIQQYMNDYTRSVPFKQPLPPLLGPRQSHCGGIHALSHERIPHNLIFNSKHGIKRESVDLQENVKRYEALYPNWTVFEDTDETCLEKLLSLDFMSNSNSTEQFREWYTDKGTIGPFKSDACRMAQLWLHGGIYFVRSFCKLHSRKVHDLTHCFLYHRITTLKYKSHLPVTFSVWIWSRLWQCRTIPFFKRFLAHHLDTRS
jgi:hypothetical protein